MRSYSFKNATNIWIQSRLLNQLLSQLLKSISFSISFWDVSAFLFLVLHKTTSNSWETMWVNMYRKPYPLVASNVYKPGSPSAELNSLKSNQFHSDLAMLTMAAKFSGVMAAIGLLFVGILLACTPAVASKGSEGNLLAQPIKEVTELITGYVRSLSTCSFTCESWLDHVGRTFLIIWHGQLMY